MIANPFDLSKKHLTAEQAEARRAYEAKLEEDDLVETVRAASSRRCLARLIEQMGRRDSTFSQDALVMAGRSRLNEFAMSLERLIEQVAPEEALLMHQERIEARIQQKEQHDRRQ